MCLTIHSYLVLAPRVRAWKGLILGLLSMQMKFYHRQRSLLISWIIKPKITKMLASIVNLKRKKLNKVTWDSYKSCKLILMIQEVATRVHRQRQTTYSCKSILDIQETRNHNMFLLSRGSSIAFSKKIRQSHLFRKIRVKSQHKILSQAFRISCILLMCFRQTGFQVTIYLRAQP